MKLLKPKKIPNKILMVAFDCYMWGYRCGLKKELIEFEDFKKQLNEGYKKV